MRAWVWLGALALFALHQDFWLWDDRSLVLGFLPAGLAWHAAYSLAAGGFWALVVMRAWPRSLDDDEADASEGATRP
ncbi:MAG: hypothetical protein H6746_19980 [Deltaproteobacteria bacterium]|nr:hypothetical protein [Deltaproteobacteria bacterium]